VLTTAPGSTPASLRSVDYTYNALGNILTHSDVGQYVYGTGNSPGVSGNGPHTLLAINGTAGKVTQPRYSYDANGNITQVTSAAVNGSVPSATRTHSWTSFDNPLALTQNHRNTATNTIDNTQVAFLYGPDHQRIREVSSQTVSGVTSQKTLAILHPDNAGALYFERETLNTGAGAGTANAVQNRHYLSAEKGAFLLITSNTSLLANPTPTTTALVNAEQRYWHKDHLGSIVASTNQNLTVIERMAYEPFGKRRFANGQYDQAGTIEGQSTNRGFTGHEHLDSLDFIHMNARVYDPDIGRFLSPDPTVAHAHNPQSFNRYSYGYNNPLNSVDPTGFTVDGNENAFTGTQMELAKDNKVETTDKAGQANSQTANDPKGGKTTSGLGLKGGLADMFPDDAPIHQIGKALAAVGIVVDGKLTNNPAKVDVGMQVLSDEKVQNMQLLGTLLGSRAPGKGPSLTTSPARTTPPGPVQTFETSRAARRAAMREANIPTSQQPVDQSKLTAQNPVKSYTYEAPKPGGGTQQMSVQNQTMDRSHKNEPHWEAGAVKTDRNTGATLSNQYGTPSLRNDGKAKANY
jgi:RHS repeat-associated protein